MTVDQIQKPNESGYYWISIDAGDSWEPARYDKDMDWWELLNDREGNDSTEQLAKNCIPFNCKETRLRIGPMIPEYKG